MATSKVKVILNSAAPESTKDEIIKEFKNQDANAAVDIIRDSNGKVVAVYLDNVLPEAAATARAAVLENKGVATISPVITQQLIISDLHDTTGIAYTGPALSLDMKQLIVVAAGVGELFGYYSSAGYVDLNEYPEGRAVILSFGNMDTANDLVIPSNSVSIQYNGILTPLTIANINNIVLPAPVVGQGNNNAYWLDTAGKCYLYVRIVNGSVAEQYTYEEAIAKGAV